MQGLIFSFPPRLTYSVLFLHSGFKFLPVLGRYIADCFEGKATPEVREKWRLPSPSAGGERIMVNDGSRRGPPRRTLGEEERLKARL